MAAVTVCSAFGAQEKEVCHYFPLFPFYLPCSNGAGCHDLRFLYLVLSQLFHCLASASSSGFSVSLLFLSLRVVKSAYLRLLIFLPAILIPACNSSNSAFLLMYSVYRLNKQGDSRQPCHILFSILNQSIVPYMVLTVAF